MTDKITLAAVGDIMLGDHPVCYGYGVRSTARRNGLKSLLNGVTPTLRKHDIFFGNLECVLSNFNHDESKLPSSELRGDPESAKDLNICRHNVFSVANNHMLQHGSPAFEETCNLLAQNNGAAVGIWVNGMSNVVIVEEAGVKLAFISHSFRPEHFCQENSFYAHGSADLIVEQVAAIKYAHPDHHIILSLHWGEEYLHTPSNQQIELAHRFIDAGVKLVLGHHPHVLQGVEEYNGGLIAYSLGNFLFDSWQTATRETAILTCEFSAGGIHKYAITPAFIGRGYRISVDAPETRKIPALIEKYSNDVINRSDAAGLSDADYQDLAAKTYMRYRLECYLYFFTHLWKYNPAVIFSSLLRSALRRLGLA